MDYWGGHTKRAYHHTAPINALYGLHEALVILQQEGLENAWARHQAMHEYLFQGLSDLGVQFLVDKAYRLPQLNSVKIPEGLDDAAIRSELLNQYNLELGAGLGVFAGKVWRIGLMGYSARAENVLLCLNALRVVMGK